MQTKPFEDPGLDLDTKPFEQDGLRETDLA